MKIVVINFSGNVGKTMIARHLLSPRLDNASIIPLESINSDNSQDNAIRGKEFGSLLVELALTEKAVVDVGASNAEDFLSQMRQYHGSHEDFDFFVVPVTPGTKQQRDTISTIDALFEMGITPEKIRVIFNMLEYGDAPERIFAGLLDYHATEGRYTLLPEAQIHASELFNSLSADGSRIHDILDDTTDLKAAIKNTTKPDEKLRYARRLAMRRLADGVNLELDTVFASLCG